MANLPGWAPVGQRLLNEYREGSTDLDTAPTSRFLKTWKEIKAMQSMGNLVELAVGQMRLLHAVDTFPRGGLCQGGALKEALRRYERLWLPLIAALAAAPGSSVRQGYSQLVPPLDVAFLWHLHRLQLSVYEEDCCQLKGRDGRSLTAALHVTAQQAFAFTDGSDPAGAVTAALWKKAYPTEPFYPPAAPGSQTAGFRSYLAADLAAVAVRVPVFTHQLLRSCYNQLPFLKRAVDRYAKFLLLRKHHLELQHPIPPLDVALMWSSHMSASAAYVQDMQQLLGYTFLDMPGASASLWLERDVSGPWRFHWTYTQRAWLDEFGEAFVVRGSGYVPMDCPHPAELSLSPEVLAMFEEQGPAAAAAAAPAGPAAAKRDVSSSWRAGAHALYLSWLRNPSLLQHIQQQIAEDAAARQPAVPQPPPPAPATPLPAAPAVGKKKSSGGLFACFGCGGASADEDLDGQQQQRVQQQPAVQPQAAVMVKPVTRAQLSDVELGKVAAGFSSFQNLPHSSTHLYWRQLSPRVSDSALLAAADSVHEKPQAGAEVEVFAAASNGHRDVGRYDQGVVTGDYEVQVAGGQPLLW